WTCAGRWTPATAAWSTWTPWANWPPTTTATTWCCRRTATTPAAWKPTDTRCFAPWRARPRAPGPTTARHTCFTAWRKEPPMLTRPVHAVGASLRVMVALWCALCGAGAAAGFWRQRRRPAPPRRPLRPDAAELLLAAVVVLAVAAVTLNTVLNTTYKNWDDQT